MALKDLLEKVRNDLDKILDEIENFHINNYKEISEEEGLNLTYVYTDIHAVRDGIDKALKED